MNEFNISNFSFKTGRKFEKCLTEYIWQRNMFGNINLHYASVNSGHIKLSVFCVWVICKWIDSLSRLTNCMWFGFLAVLFAAAGFVYRCYSSLAWVMYLTLSYVSPDPRQLYMEVSWPLSNHNLKHINNGLILYFCEIKMVVISGIRR